MWCDEIETGGKWVSRPIKPGSAERRTIHNVASFVIVLGIVLIEAGATNVVEVAFEQSIVGFADMCWKAVSQGAWFPEDDIACAGSTHDRPTMIRHKSTTTIGLYLCIWSE